MNAHCEFESVRSNLISRDIYLTRHLMSFCEELCCTAQVTMDQLKVVRVLLLTQLKGNHGVCE